MKKNVFLIVLMAVLVLFPFEFLQSKGEITDGSSRQILLRGRLSYPKLSSAKPIESDLSIDAWINGNIITVNFDSPLFNPNFNISIKEDSALEVYSNDCTIDESNTLILIFERDSEKEYRIEISNEDGFLSGYF